MCNFPINLVFFFFPLLLFYLLFFLKCLSFSVSSVLNKDVKQHGKTFMYDGLDDTAWYSDQVNRKCENYSIFYPKIQRFALHVFCYHFQGSPQCINILFNEPLESLALSSCQLKIKFQGGFVGSVMTVSIDDSNCQNYYKKSFYPDDINDFQTFTLATDADADSKTLSNVKRLSIVFEKSSDFFGRIIIYHLELLA